VPDPHGRLRAEERIREERRRKFVDERRDFARQLRAVRHVPRLHQRNELVVDVVFADAVCDDVDAGAKQIFGVVQIEQISGHAQARDGALRRSPHDRRRGTFGLRAEIVVDANLAPGWQGVRRENIGNI
jgi:hypothetical protein